MAKVGEMKSQLVLANYMVLSHTNPLGPWMRKCATDSTHFTMRLTDRTLRI